MRVMVAYELFSMWQKLGLVFFLFLLLLSSFLQINIWLFDPGDNKPHFIPGMMGPFLGVTLVPQTEVRNIMIPIFHDMMDWEQRKNGNFKQVCCVVRARVCVCGFLAGVFVRELTLTSWLNVCVGGGRADG